MGATLTYSVFIYYIDIFWVCSAETMSILPLLLVVQQNSMFSVSIVISMLQTYLCYGYMDSLMHEVRYVVSWTTPLCVLTLKLIGLTWDVYDGGQKVRVKSCYVFISCH